MFNLNAFAKGYSFSHGIKEARKNRKLEDAKRKLAYKNVTSALDNYDSKRKEEEKRKQDEYNYKKQMEDIKLSEAQANQKSNALSRAITDKENTYKLKHFGETKSLEEKKNKLSNMQTDMTLRNFDAIQAQNMDINSAKAKAAIGDSRLKALSNTSKMILYGDINGAHKTLVENNIISEDDKLQQVPGGVVVIGADGKPKMKLSNIEALKSAGGKKFQQDFTKISSKISSISKLNFELNSAIKGQNASNDLHMPSMNGEVHKYDVKSKEKHIKSEIQLLYKAYPEQKDIITNMLSSSDMSQYIPKNFIKKTKKGIESFDPNSKPQNTSNQLQNYFNNTGE